MKPPFDFADTAAGKLLDHLALVAVIAESFVALVVVVVASAAGIDTAAVVVVVVVAAAVGDCIVHTLHDDADQSAAAEK